MAMSSPYSSREHLDPEDQVSATNTSSSDQEREYVVNRIEAQSLFSIGEGEEEDMYLVRWDGYADEQCTWEPKEAFLSKETLDQWERRKAQGQILSQDEVDEIVSKMDAYAEAKPSKRKRRQVQSEQQTRTGKSDIVAAARPRNNSLVKPGQRNTYNSESLARNRNTNSYPSEYPQSLLFPVTTKPLLRNFEGIGIEPKSRRSSHRPLSTASRGMQGLHFKTLRTQYRHQKAGKNEPAPDPKKIKLKPATDIVAAAGEDIAHILPSGSSRSVPPLMMSLQSTRFAADHVEPLRAMPTGTIQSAADPTNAQYAPLPGHEAPVSAASHNSVSAALVPQRRDIYYIPNGHYWFHGEVLVDLTLQAQPVGDVRIIGLPKWFRTKLISLKLTRQISLDFQLVELWQYHALCRGRSDYIRENAYITAFEDSQEALTELADSLAHNNRAALWYHPEGLHVLVAYAAGSNDWHFLDRGLDFPPEITIHLALRGSMPKIEALATLQASGRPAAPLPQNETILRPQVQLTPQESPPQGVDLQALDTNSMTTRQPQPKEAVVSNLSEIVATEDRESTDRRLSGSSMESGEDSESPVEHDEPSSLPFVFVIPSGESIDDAFRNQFGISYDYLTRLSALHKDMYDPTKARFYLAFPPSHQTEMDALRTLLSKHTLPNLICTSSEPQGWEGFKSILGDKSGYIGVILFHFKYLRYSGLPGLDTLLKMVNVNLFNLSLRKKLPHSSFPTHIGRLFPTGTAILLTQSSILHRPEQTLAILRWFSQIGKTKRGTWKIVLIPNVRHWLRKAALSAGALQACFWAILTEISELLLGQSANYRNLENDDSEAESFDECDDEVGKPSLVVSPANIPAYDRCQKGSTGSTEFECDRILVEWFAGWAVQNVQKHRRFAAISAMAAIVDQESRRWAHLEVVAPDNYMLRNKIPFQGSAPNDSPR